MASAPTPRGSTVPELMVSVKRLTPAELTKFKREFAAWQNEKGAHAEEESALIEACKARLPPAEERRLKKLISKSEGGSLSHRDLADYRSLVRRAEQLDATRLAAVTQLSRRWGKPVSAILQTVGWEGGDHETASDSARSTKPGPRPRG